ncbi:MAG: restriction endonuclease subunit S [Bacilli bacterium]|nr:restriction endonuclease subunit S [Bacilli bacterium]
MMIDELKISILNYAFSGQLSKTKNTDKSIEEMKNIFEEKHSELIEKKIVKLDKKVTLPSEKDYPYCIPNTWYWSKLYYVIDVRDGTHDSPKYHKQGVPLITSKNLNIDGTLDKENVKYISNDDADIINNRSKVDIGDILFAMIGSIGNPVVIMDEPDFCIKNVALFKNSNKDILDNEYLYYYLVYSQVKMKKESSGGVQQFVSLNYLRNFYIPIPPIEEQKRIVNKVELLFSKLDEIHPIECELNELKSNFTNKIKTSILVYLMNGKLGTNIPVDKKVDINSDIIYDEIPKNWLRVKSKDILNITTGKKDANYGTEDGLYDFYTCASIPIKAPTYSFEGKNLILPGNGANVGLTIYCEDKFEAYQRTYVASPKYGDDIIVLKYIYYYFCAFWNDYNKNKMFGSAIPYIKLGNLENFEINIPPLEEQKRIINIIEELLPLCNDIDRLVMNRS